MAYTDTDLTNVKIKKVHITELETAIKAVITAAKLTSSVSIGTLSYTKVNAGNVSKLQKAINSLESKFSNNCCESNKCQTCQSDKCEKCQEACSCQSNKCEKCQEACSCQSNKCQKCQRQCDCDCDCGDDSSGE